MEIIPVLKITSAVILPVICFTWGIITINNRIFPYNLIKNIVTNKNNFDCSVAAKARGFDLFTISAEIVFIGDSIIEDAQWQDMFSSKRIANRGIACDTTRGIITRMDGILATRAKKAFIMVGFNDFHGGALVEEVFNDYCKIVRMLENAGVTVVIQSTIECTQRLRLIHHKIKALNEKLRHFATSNGNLWIDLNACLASSDSGLISDYSYDGIHLNGDGYYQWRELITDVVHAPDLSDQRPAELRFISPEADS